MTGQAAAAAPPPNPDYGFDAPGVALGMFTAGLASVLAGLAAAAWGGVAAGVLCIALLILGAVPLLLAGAMLAYNRRGKRRMRDLMLGAVPWSGSERVLDVGTGAGLLLTGAARLTTGGVVGVDIWSAKDLSGNSREQTLRNAAAEGMADQVEVRTANALALPFPDASFDRVLSLLCLHNVVGPDSPQQACREIARVLRPGGAALIGDYVPTGRYAATLRDAGLVIEQSGPRFGTALSLMWLVVARKPA